MRKAHKIALAALAVILCSCVAVHSASIFLKQFTFNEDKALTKWSKIILNGQVDYKILKEGDESYVRALSEQACSAIYSKVRFKLKDYPILTWQWRVLEFPDISKTGTEVDRNDYAARVYVIFPSFTFSLSRFIEYVWSESEPVGAILDSPAGKNVKMIVVRSGRANASEWVAETRNMYEDYREAFGTRCARKAGAIAIMCDADGSLSTAESAFDNIAIKKIK